MGLLPLPHSESSCLNEPLKYPYTTSFLQTLTLANTSKPAYTAAFSDCGSRRSSGSLIFLPGTSSKTLQLPVVTRIVSTGRDSHCTQTNLSRELDKNVSGNLGHARFHGALAANESALSAGDLCGESTSPKSRFGGLSFLFSALAMFSIAALRR